MLLTNMQGQPIGHSQFKAFSQCRKPIDGVWSDDPSWECHQPGDMPSGSGDSSTSTPGSDGTSNMNETGDTPSTGGNVGGGSSVMPASQPSQAPEPAASTAPASTSSSHMSSGQDTNNQQSGQPPSGQTASMGTSQNLPEMYANASATLGGCNNVQVPDGWDGVASTSVRSNRF